MLHEVFVGDVVKNSIYSPVRNFKFASDDLGRPISDSIMMFKAENLPPLGYKVYTINKSNAEEAEEQIEQPQVVYDEIRAGYQV